MQSSINRKQWVIVYNFFITNVYDTKLLTKTLPHFPLTHTKTVWGKEINSRYLSYTIVYDATETKLQRYLARN